MCGIVGYVGDKQVVPLLMDGLGRLEYRGYDSAGVVVVENDELSTRKAEGKLSGLRDKLAEIPADRPVVTVCQSGKRSAMATQILLKNGITRAANLAGGMIQWNRLGLPLAG